MAFNLYPVASDNIINNSITDMAVVLDLDSTLIHTMESMDSIKNLGIMTNPSLMELKRRCYCLRLDHIDDRGSGDQFAFWGLHRKNLEEFLLFCFNYFKLVIVWSAGKKNYVHAIVDDIFKNLRKPHLVWTFDDIETSSDGDVVKPINKLLNSDFPHKHLLSVGKIIVVDDNPTTFVKNKKNAVLIPPFEPELNIAALSADDNTLLQLKYWLLLPHVINSSDITKIDLNNIFSESHDTYIDIANSYDYY